VDLPRSFAIRESSHRILNPFTPEKLATLGQALHLRAGTSVLDLASGKGEMLCTWARDHGISGIGVDISTAFTRAAEARADEIGVADRVTLIRADASTFVAPEPVHIAACCGATWIGGGVAGTIRLLERSLCPSGIILIGEPFWRAVPPDQETVEACYAQSRDDFKSLPGLIELIQECGWDLVEMVLANQDSWDRYAAAQWFNIRTWLDANPDDELAGRMREELMTGPLRHIRGQREYLGWGVFVLMRR
jgi:SAM-dependent methyltransferase